MNLGEVWGMFGLVTGVIVLCLLTERTSRGAMLAVLIGWLVYAGLTALGANMLITDEPSIAENSR